MTPASAPTLKMQDAAALLNVSPSTLRNWERRFGYPLPLRSAGGHRMYPKGEIVALRDALGEGLSISSAVGRARASLGTRPEGLARALFNLDFERADSAMEAALALGTVERAVEDVLLAGFSDLAQRAKAGGAIWSLAARWGIDWLHRAQRLCPSPSRPMSILVGDSCRPRDMDEIALTALELLCVRGGVQVRNLPVGAAEDLADVLDRSIPHMVVLAGVYSGGEAASRWIAAVRRLFGTTPLLLYRPPDGARETPGATEALPSSPAQASAQLLASTRTL